MNAIRFYERMGATVMPDWRICRIAGDTRSPPSARSDAMAEAGVDRYAELHAGFRWHVPARLQHRRGLLHAAGRRETPRRDRDPLRARGRLAHATSATASSTAPPTASPRRCARSASAAATASRSSCRSASRPRSRTSRSTGSARSRCRCRCCSAPTRSSTASTTAARASRSSTRAASPTCSRRGRSARSWRRVVAVGARRGPGRRRLAARCSRRERGRFDAGRRRAPTTPRVLIYTSGTTGPPKGALIPHRALIGNLPGFVCSQNWFPQDDAVFWSPGRLGVDRRPDGRAAADALLRPRDRRLPGPLRARDARSS